jgi:PadR family transcriptional regulator PadR
MGKGDNLGEFEELVMLAVLALAGDAYGFAIRELLAEEANRNVQLATVHSALYRLEDKGFLRSRLGGTTEVRGGRSKRLFKITAPGQAAVDQQSMARQSLRLRVSDMRTI